MNELSLEKPAGVLVKTTLVDYPGLVAGSFFLRGCNLRCPYCYNKGLIDNSDEEASLNTINELFSHLEKRQGLLQGIVISGGDPLINPYTPLIIKKAKSLGYKIKLDTNGILPDELEYFVNSPALKPDFLAMDIKTTPEKYASILCNPKSKYYGNAAHFEKVLNRSIKIISEYEASCREFRTVLVPTLINEAEIKEIAALLPSDASWRFSNFQNKNCLDESYNELSPYTDAEAKNLVFLAQKLISDSKLR